MVDETYGDQTPWRKPQNRFGCPRRLPSAFLWGSFREGHMMDRVLETSF